MGLRVRSVGLLEHLRRVFVTNASRICGNSRLRAEGSRSRRRPFAANASDQRLLGKLMRPLRALCRTQLPTVTTVLALGELCVSMCRSVAKSRDLCVASTLPTLAVCQHCATTARGLSIADLFLPHPHAHLPFASIACPMAEACLQVSQLERRVRMAHACGVSNLHDQRARLVAHSVVHDRNCADHWWTMRGPRRAARRTPPRCLSCCPAPCKHRWSAILGNHFLQESI